MIRLRSTLEGERKRERNPDDSEVESKKGARRIGALTTRHIQ